VSTKEDQDLKSAKKSDLRAIRDIREEERKDQIM